MGGFHENAIPVCETFKTSCLMGSLNTKGVLENLFKGPIIPFGSLAEYYLFLLKDQSRIHQFGKKVLPGLFLGYALYAEGIWKGDIMAADIEELETMAAPKIYSERCKGSVDAHEMKKVFQVADGRIKFPGGDQDLRTSTLTRERPERGEEQINLQGRSDELHYPTPLQDDSTCDDAEAKHDFWSTTGDFIFRHHVEPRVKLYVPKEESFPIPLKYIDVTRNTHTSLDFLMEKIMMLIGTWMEIVNCQTHGLHKIYFTERKATLRIYMVRGRD